MAKVTRAQVVQWYRQYLGRDPYPSETSQVNAWVAQGANAQQGIANSDEAKARAGGGGAPGAVPAPVDPLEATRKMITDWYSQKPATPGTFTYSPAQEAADKLSVGQEYRPFYQEQASQSGDAYQQALSNAREGFSRRGLWGAAGGMEKKIDPATGLEMTTAGAPATTGGPASGLRQVGENNMATSNERSNTAFGRAYTEAVAGGVQGRQAEAQDIYSKTIRQPYEDQYKAWQDRLAGLTAGLK